jgi:uncharacterized protein (TIGR03437 family)
VGSHTVGATYNGDANYGAATPAAATFAVSRASGQIAVSSDRNPASPAQSIAFTALVSAAAGLPTPTGSVQWSDGASVLASTALYQEKAAWMGPLSAGLHAIAATYLGDATFTAATSMVYWQTVNKLETATALSVAANTLLATVASASSGSGTPTGSVSLVDSATNAVIAAAPVVAGSATFGRPASRSVSAVYSGDSNFLGSGSAVYVPLAAAGAASYATGSFAPDELVTLFGSSLGAGAVTVTDSAGSTRPASLLFTSPTQANIVLPGALASGPAAISFTDSSGFTVSASLMVNAVAPGLFTANGAGTGVPAGQMLRVHADGSSEAPQDLAAFDSATNQWTPVPINLGTPSDAIYLILYGSGIRHFAAMPTCVIGPQTASVVYAGPQGTFPGLDQINIRLPENLPSGALSLTVTADRAASNAVTIAIR